MNAFVPAGIGHADFDRFRQLLHRIAGISLADSKKSLLVGRLASRLKQRGVASYADYYRLVNEPGEDGELQVMVDLLTTNETYFFREEAHFEFLRRHVFPGRTPSQPFDFWSAASSTGDEAYTLAMVLAEAFGTDAAWTILGSDISTRAVAAATRAVYRLDRVRGLTQHWLRRYCLKGVRSQEGSFIIAPELRRHVRFVQVNLNEPLPKLGPFDVVFLRNVMIYFDARTKREVVGRVASRLKPGGYLIVGHSESLNGINEDLVCVKPTIYRRPG